MRRREGRRLWGTKGWFIGAEGGGGEERESQDSGVVEGEEFLPLRDLIRRGGGGVVVVERVAV